MNKKLKKDGQKRVVTNQNFQKNKILITCEFGELPLDLDEIESEKIKFCRNPKDWRCGCGG